MTSKEAPKAIDPTSGSDKYAQSYEGSEQGRQITRRQPPKDSDESSETSEDFFAEPEDSDLSISEWEGSQPETEEHLRKRKDEKRQELRHARRAERKKIRRARMEREEGFEGEAKKEMFEPVEEHLEDSDVGGGAPLIKKKRRKRGSKKNKGKATASAVAN